MQHSLPSLIIRINIEVMGIYSNGNILSWTDVLCTYIGIAYYLLPVA